MKQLFLFLLLSVPLFAEDAINVASEDYGAYTKKETNSIQIQLPIDTNVNEIQLNFKPNKGKLIILQKDGKKEKELASLVLDGTEEEAKFKLQKTFLKDVKIIFVPEDNSKPLVVDNYGFYVLDAKAIQVYTSIQKVILKDTSASAGASIEPQQILIPQTTPVTLPTEFTISRSSL